MARFINKWISWYLVLAMFVIGVTPRAYAGFAPSEIIGLSPADRNADLRKIQFFLEMKMVQERLRQFGYTPEEVQSRLSQVDDQQLHQLALKLDDLNVAGDSGLGVVIAVLIIVILVIVIIQLLGHKIVIKKD
jgi:hypothetical protein